MRKRNPILGGIMAAIFIGFGGWRLYNYYVLDTFMETYQLILGYGITIYGFYLVYVLMTQNNDKS